MKKYTLILLILISFTANSQIVNKFRDSTWFAKGVRFDSEIYLTKGASNGKVLTSNAFGCATWQNASGGVSQTTLNDSITAVRSIRKVDTIYKNNTKDSIVFTISGIRYAVKDSFNLNTDSQTLSISNDTLTISGGNSVILPVYVQADSSTIFSYDVLNSQNAPPGSPAIGDTYLVGNSPSGAWAGHAKDIAEWNGSAWVFTDGLQGDFLYNATNALTYIFRSGNWVQTTGIPALNNGNTTSSGLRIGTNNARSLTFETNNVNRGRFDSIGRFYVYDTSLRKANKYLQIDSITGRLVASEISGGGGTVTSVSVVTVNGISGTVANATTTPAITLQVDTISKFATRKQLLDSIDRINTAINTKQETLISGTNIKTVNSNSILGSGNITVSGSSSLSGLTDATTASTLANGTNVITWNWSGLSAGTKGLIFGGTDILVNGITVGLGKYQNTSNVAIGYYALNASTGGIYNTAIGSNALNKLTNGSANTAIGDASLSSLTTGTNNIAIGRQALVATSGGQENIGIGDFSLTSMGTAYSNIAIGKEAMYYLNTGNYNVAVGRLAFVNVKGSNNTGIGYSVGTNLTTGTNNTIIGYNTGLGITTGGKNTIIGANISGLATTLSNTIILADGDGVIRYYCNSAGSTGIGTTTPNASAKLDVSSTTQGVLLPRMTTTQKNAISSPAEGLEVYDLTLHQKSYYNGTTWINY